MIWPVFKRSDDDNKIELVEDFFFYSKIKNRVFVIKKGFKSDGLTIPKFVEIIIFFIRSLVPRWGRTDVGAIVHDWLMQNQPEGWCLKDVNKQADIIHEDYKVKKYLRLFIHIGNRIGGRYYWNKYCSKK